MSASKVLLRFQSYNLLLLTLLLLHSPATFADRGAAVAPYSACDVTPDDLRDLKDLAACQLSHEVKNCVGLGFTNDAGSDSVRGPQAPHGIGATLAKHEVQAVVAKEQLKMAFIRKEIQEKHERLDHDLQRSYDLVHEQISKSDGPALDTRADRMARDINLMQNFKPRDLSSIVKDPQAKAFLESQLAHKIFKPKMQTLLNTFATKFPQEYQRLLDQVPKDASYNELLKRTKASLLQFQNGLSPGQAEIPVLKDDEVYLKSFQSAVLRTAGTPPLSPGDAESLARVLPFLASGETLSSHLLGGIKFVPKFLGSKAGGTVVWSLLPVETHDKALTDEYIEVGKDRPETTSIKEFNQLLVPCSAALGDKASGSPNPPSRSSTLQRSCKNILSSAPVCARMKALRQNARDKEVTVSSRQLTCDNSGEIKIDAVDTRGIPYQFIVGTTRGNSPGDSSQFRQITIQKPGKYGGSLVDYAKFEVTDGQFSMENLQNPKQQVPVTLVASALSIANCCLQSGSVRGQCLQEFNSPATASPGSVTPGK